MLWRSDDPVKDASLRPGNRQGPLRPLAAFLEPSARLTEWRLASSQVAASARRKKGCWCPLEVEATPYPWPWSGAPRWVEANSVFFKGAVIQRPLSDKELSQLMDLREDWGPSLIHILLEWDSGASPPLRMSVEFILSAFSWLGLDSGHVLLKDDASLARKKPNESFSDWDFDWARICSPFVGAPGSKAIPDSLVEQFAYFGWVSPQLPRPMMLRPILPYGMLVVMVLGWSMHVPLLGIGYIRGGGGR